MEPLGVALHVINRLKINFLDSITIVGAGAIGLCITYILKSMNCKQIFFVGQEQYRVDFARKLDFILYHTSENYVQQIKESTQKTGTSCTVDASGNSEAVDSCINCAAISSRMGLVGIPDSDYLTYNPHKMRIRNGYFKCTSF